MDAPRRKREHASYVSNVLWVGGVEEVEGEGEEAMWLITGLQFDWYDYRYIYISIFYNYFCAFDVFGAFNTFDALVETVLYLSNFLQSKYDFDYC